MDERVLLVEDDASIREVAALGLTQAGFAVTTASDGRQGLLEFRQGPFDLVVLDLMLPELDGFEVCREIRRESRVPIVMLSARSDTVDVVVGLELGADDYVTKPYSARELVARIRAVLRRRSDAEPAAEAVLEAGPVRMDVERHVVAVDGASVTLPLKEFDLLELLLRNAGRVDLEPPDGERLLRRIFTRSPHDGPRPGDELG